PNRGLFISLSYCGGPDVVAATNYLPSMQAQLAAEGLTLLELYYLEQSPGVHLVVALKETRKDRLDAYIKRLRMQPRLTRIHGRAHCARDALSAFSIVPDVPDVVPQDGVNLDRMSLLYRRATEPR